MSAIARIQVSRERLRRAMSPPPRAPAPAGASFGTAWLAKLKSLPIVDVVVESLIDWWSRHPLRPVTQVAGEASSAVVGPAARRHPIALVVLAAVAGALLVRGRPWRWLWRSALFAGLVPQLASRLVASLPVESWLQVLASAIEPRRPTPRTPPTRERTAGP